MVSRKRREKKMKNRLKTLRADKIKCGDFLENRWGAWEMVQSIVRNKDITVLYSYGEIKLLMCGNSHMVNIKRRC